MSLTTEKYKRNSFFTEFTSGTAAGVVGTVIGYPLDTIKVRLQTEGKGGKYSSTRECFTHIVKHEKVGGLFKGISSPLVGLTFLNAISFGCYSQFKSIIVNIKKRNANGDSNGNGGVIDSNGNGGGEMGIERDKMELKLWDYWIAGGCTGITNSIFSSAFDIVKIRMQLEGSQFNSSWDCVKTTVQKFGIRKGLYAGMGPNVIREFIFCSNYFATYETMKKWLHVDHVDQGDTLDYVRILSIMFSGGMSGVWAWSCCFPVDAIFSNIQRYTVAMQEHHQHANFKRKGMIEMARDMYHRNGMRTFYSGLGTSVARACIVSSTRFLAYEITKQLLNSGSGSKNSNGMIKSQEIQKSSEKILLSNQSPITINSKPIAITTRYNSSSRADIAKSS